MRSRMFATAAVAAAFVMVPAGSALAGSGPAPAPSERASSQSTAPTPEGNPLSKRAQASDVCYDARQIGETRHIKQGGEIIASVKHFSSSICEADYSYVWLWQSFVDKEDDYDVSAGMFNYAEDGQQGQVSWPKDNGQEYWSERSDASYDCKAAVGSVRPAGSATTYSGQTDKRC
ncbi:hypothetical protein DVA86_02750 [Streptomyces armeniacus]|uniref:DUF2690 domain-containing protein n=1 Tax=Streptomyces armeniacus TaxID=83291 RepID=A0A345XJB1_9ACTN|nr:hypothetical protein [Streptomyces armeniacus]AXK31727.1 hypothetical protein DVA86_02750 [Streptomyces armeniacus]